VVIIGVFILSIALNLYKAATYYFISFRRAFILTLFNFCLEVFTYETLEKEKFLEA
jgi:hypothetical protein